VVIQSDSEASIELLVDITTAAREAGVNDVAVSTEKK
jgi:biopolymer transport protein ExbD